MYCHILRVRAIPTLECTDSMISPHTLQIMHTATYYFGLLGGHTFV